MKKMSSDSWVDEIQINDNNFLGRKTTDYSTFNKGTTISQRYDNMFLNCLSKNISRDEQVKVKIFIKDKCFNGAVRWPGSKDRKGVTIQLNYSEKSLLEILRDKLSVSYDYIIKYIDEKGKKPTKIPKEYKEYIDFYKGNEIDTFIIKLVPKNENHLEDTEIIDYDDEDIANEELDLIEEVENKFYDIIYIKDEVKYIHKYIKSKGVDYDEDLIKNFYLSLKTKPFVILS